MHLFKATGIAVSVYDLIKPACKKIIIAGSIRRGVEEVGDIEIVALPKMVRERKKLIVSHDFHYFVKKLGLPLKGDPDGRYMQIKMVEGKGFLLDLFMPQEHDFIRMVVMRTGSKDFSHNIARTWNKMGWCGTDDGLRLITECKPAPGKTRKWKCIAETPTLPPVWQTEQEFFKWLKIPYVEPNLRN